MTPKELQILEAKILTAIPILQNMGIQIQSMKGTECVLGVPLKQNHNHKNTAFGGSLYAACTAACYALIYALQIHDRILQRDLVITQGSIQYFKPVSHDFTVRASVDLQTWKSFTSALAQSKPHRLSIQANVHIAGKVDSLCQFDGKFALLPSKS